MNRDSDFFARSQEVVRRFLQTALVVDDRAFLRDAEPAIIGPLNPPATPLTIAPHSGETADSSPADVAPDAAGMSESTGLSPHGLDAESVINGFALRGIVCSVLRRKPEDTLANQESSLGQLASVADILVLDWQVHSAEGESTKPTLELLEGVVERNRAENPRQLRLIVVYTGEVNLLKVAEEIRSRLEEKLGAVEVDGEFAFTQGAVRIVVLGKETVGGRSPAAKAQEASFSDLASRTISEFTVMTAGLVSNVVLDALARLRCATHRILGRFPASLDEAFLVHRALLNPPQEADEHLGPIIAGELQAVIEDAAEPFPSTMVREWLEARRTKAPTHEASGFANAEAEREWLLRLCEEGHRTVVEKPFPDALKWLRKIRDGRGCAELDQLIALIGGTTVPGANEELAILMSCKTRYSEKPPWLTLGTIVMQKNENAKTFWLCLQPVCDTVRLTEARVFPMLRLEESTKRFSLIVRADDAFVRLAIDPRTSNLRTVKFEPDVYAQAVVAKSDENQFWFESKDPKFRCRWIAELKFEQAQRAVQDMANQNSRVGLTESEWQRRWDR